MAPLVFPYQPIELSATIKTSPQDFIVEEQLGFEPSGEGEHLLLHVEKVGITTHQLVEDLARQAGIRPRDVGYSGLKDRQAVTRQWLSLHLPGQREKLLDTGFSNEGYRILQANWHHRKLRVGSHQANSFEVVLRKCIGDWGQAMERVEEIRQYGFANYFGVQRFGSAGDNIASALHSLNNSRKKKRLSRTRKSLYLSSLRSELFNRILARRLESGVWLEPLNGDLLMLDGSHSYFSAEIDPELLQRYRKMDIHSAISLFGKGQSGIKSQAKDIEQAVFADSSELVDCLDRQDIKLGYRPCRARVEGLYLESQGDQARLSVTLARGCYLTTLLDHIALTDMPHQ